MDTWDPENPTPEQEAAMVGLESAIAAVCLSRGWLETDEMVTEWLVCVYMQRASDRPGRGTHAVLGPMSQPVHHEEGLLRQTLRYIAQDDEP